jgi:hypothetical protein
MGGKNERKRAKVKRIYLNVSFFFHIFVLTK